MNGGLRREGFRFILLREETAGQRSFADGFGFVFGEDHGRDFGEAGAEGFGVAVPAVDEDGVALLGADDDGDGGVGFFGFVPVDFYGFVIHGFELGEGAHLHGAWGGLDHFFGFGEVIAFAAEDELFA